MNYNYQLSVLTPVHIGDGDSYRCKEYYLTKSKLNGKPIKLINRVNLNDYVLNLSQVDQNKFFKNINNKNFKLKESMNNIKESKIYHSIEDTIVKNNKSQHPKTIESMIKNNEKKAYIPGSSIKGSIKTAILYDILKKYDKSLSYEEYNTISNDTKLEKIMSKISISDSTNALNIKTIQPKSITLLSEGEKSSHKDDNKSGMYNAIECIYIGNYKFNMQLMDIDIDYLKECLYTFNKEYIEHELVFYSEISKKEKNKTDKVINYYNQLNKKNTIESPLIRVGGSTGLLSTTIALHMKKCNLEVFQENFKDKNENIVNENFPKIRKVTPNGMPFGWCRFKSI